MKIILSTLWQNLRNILSPAAKATSSTTSSTTSNAPAGEKTATSSTGLAGSGNVDKFEEVKLSSTEQMLMSNSGLLGAEATAEGKIAAEVVYDISKLNNTQNFQAGGLAHILEGELNKKGDAVGFHYEGMPNQKGRVIPGTEKGPNAQGVYTAKVEVAGVRKNSFSSFFPKDWTPQQIVDAINEAYENRQLISGDKYSGISSSGIEIHMYLNKNKITTAFPIFQ